jgi:hypothetical protein
MKVSDSLCTGLDVLLVPKITGAANGGRQFCQQAQQASAVQLVSAMAVFNTCRQVANSANAAWLGGSASIVCSCVAVARCPLTSVSSVTPRGCTRRHVQDSSKASQVRAAHESCAAHVMACSALLAIGCVCILLWNNPSVISTLHACPLVAHSSADTHRLARAVGQGVRTHAS